MAVAQKKHPAVRNGWVSFIIVILNNPNTRIEKPKIKKIL